MDCGDAGHILFSKRVAEDVGEFREWQPHLHDIGECVVKHDVRVHLFNLHGEDFGNPAIPAKVDAGHGRGVEARAGRAFPGGCVAVLILIFIVAGWIWSDRHGQSQSVSPTNRSLFSVRKFQRRQGERLFCRRHPGRYSDGLAKIRDLRVISRTSVENYRGGKATHNLQRDREGRLDVANVLEGSVRKVGSES